MAEKVRTGRAKRSPASRAPSLLDEAAGLWGVQPEYVTQDGRDARSPDEAVLAALRALGAPVHGMADLPDAIRVGRLLQWERLVEPVVVSWVEEGAATVDLRLTPGEADAEIGCELELDGLERLEWSGACEALEDVRAVEVDGREFVRARIALPPDLPTGRHRLTVRACSREESTFVLRAPVRAWTPEGSGAPPREWGVFMPLYAMRGQRTPGVADLTDLERLQRWTHERGGAVVGTLPILAAFLDTPFEPSPYAPASRLFWNELYLDPERVPGREWTEGARSLLDGADYRGQSAKLRAQDTVDYRAAMAHRRRALEMLAREFAPVERALPVELAEFRANKDVANEYAIFRAIGERQGKIWREWPGHLRVGSVGPRDFDEEAYRYHLYVQWAMDSHLLRQGRGEGDAPIAPLYMDLPLGSHPDGFDTWAWRELFADVSMGAPPDPFIADGQNWAFPPLHPFEARKQGHAYFAACLRHQMRACTLLRLDHVMGLHRLFWIPRGMGATEGVYVRYPADELLAVLSLESHVWQTEIVGEDLGTVPDEVREDMGRHGLRRMFVVPFELDRGAATLPDVPANAVASVDTHDTPPFRALVEDANEAAAWAAAVGAPSDDPRALLDATLAKLGASPARLVLLSLEDLWLEREPQNRPGTATTENWSRKASVPLEGLDREDVRATITVVDHARRALPPRRAS